MAYDTSKLTKLAALKALAQKVKSSYALQKDLTTLSERVDSLVTAGGEPNKLEGIKINGTLLTLTDKIADILIQESTANGNIKINGTETRVYTEPADVVHGAIATDTEVTEMLNEVFGTTT